VLSTMQDVDLTITSLFRHGQRVHRRSQILTYDGSGFTTRTFGEVAERTERLAKALRKLGVAEGDRVGTLMWNTAEHVEAYFAVPGLGGVLHTLNLRLFPDQLIHIVNEAADKVVIVHSTAAGLLVKVADQLAPIEHVVVVDDGAPVPDELGQKFASVLDYEELLAAEEPGFEWPEVDERSAASMCYTSGTTGDPKGVLYSHRSTFLHAFAVNNAAATVVLNERERALTIVPMFHVNAWGYPFVCWMTGCDMVMPGRFLQGEPLAKMIEQARPTLSAGVPTIWQSLLAHVDEHPETDLSSLKCLLAGGAALPVAMIEKFDKLGIRILQGWGMTETSPICTISDPPMQEDPESVEWRARAGRIVPGVELRIVTDDGTVAPWDGTTTGEIEVRGPWITGSYYLQEPTDDKFHDGWLRTGDIGSIDDYGYMTISDRVKDVIKSGGEWISSVALENELAGHPEVAEASVVGVPDDKWTERPLAVVVRRQGSDVTAEALAAWLKDRVASWWVPERWSFVDELPKTSVGKFDKKKLRSDQADGDLEVEKIS
jgi:fatty-acyl-CoA synthase